MELERFHLASGFDNNDRERPAVELGAARKNGIDQAVGLRKRDGGHWASELVAVDRASLQHTPAQTVCRVG